MAVILARPEGPVPEQDRLCAAQILDFFIAVDWLLPAATLGGSNLLVFLEQEGKSPSWPHTFSQRWRGERHGEVACSLVKLSIFHKVGKHVVHLDKTYWRVGSEKKLLVSPERIQIVFFLINKNNGYSFH